MAKSKVTASIDIGSSKVAVIIAQIEVNPVTYESSINILGAASSSARGVKRGQIVDIEDAVDSIIVAVEAAERMAGYNLDHAFVSVGGAHISSQNSKGVVAVSDPEGEVSEQDVERVIEAARAISLPASREVIHVIPRNFIVDGEEGVKDPMGMFGVRLEVDTHIVSASSAALKNLTKAVKEVGVDIEEVVFSGYAAAQAVLSETEKELGCVLIDVGGGTTSFCAFVDGSLSYSGTIPIGAKNVTNDMAIGLRVSLDNAENIKISLSETKKDKDTKNDQIDISEGAGVIKKVSKRTVVEGIVRPRLNEVFTMVRLELEKMGLINRIPSGAIITGGGALTVGAEDSAKRMLTLPVRIGKPQGVGGLIDDILTPSYSTAIGLVLYGAHAGYGREILPGFKERFRLPSTDVFGSLLKKIKNLLP